MPGDVDLDLVRQVMARELDTINEYESFARKASAPDLRAFFQHLADEEKEHVAEALLIIRRMDPVQERKLTSPTLSVEHVVGGQRPPAGPPVPTLSSFTVGSLKRT